MSFSTYLQTTRRQAARSMHRPRRTYATHGTPTPKSAHATLYSSTFPAMIPVFLLGSAVYLGLQLSQSMLSHEKHMQEASARVQILEAEIDALQAQRTSQLDSATQSTSPAAPKADAPSRKWW